MWLCDDLTRVLVRKRIRRCWVIRRHLRVHRVVCILHISMRLLMLSCCRSRCSDDCSNKGLIRMITVFLLDVNSGLRLGYLGVNGNIDICPFLPFTPAFLLLRLFNYRLRFYDKCRRLFWMWRILKRLSFINDHDTQHKTQFTHLAFLL